MKPTTLEAAIKDALHPGFPARLGVAVSGGGDSLALLYLLHRIVARTDSVLEAVTIDHRLRAGSAAEAQEVAAHCQRLGIHHVILTWEQWQGVGNLQDAARQARYGLMSEWARARHLDAVALGHTADDQAETVLLRLARSSGVDGLAAMSVRRASHGMLWLRPLLRVRRDALRSYLETAGIAWSEDPSNEDTRFDRIKARKALGALCELGIDAESLGVVAANMGQARAALEEVTDYAALACARISAGAVVFDRNAFCALSLEVQRRLLRRAINWIVPTPYPPRRSGLAQMIDAIGHGRATTLGGCAVFCRKGEVWLFREFNEVTGHTTPLHGDWDSRWQCMPVGGCPTSEDHLLREIGANGLKQCGNWRDLALPRGVLLSHPGLWHGDTLLSSPAAKNSSNWTWKLLREEKAFFRPAL